MVVSVYEHGPDGEVRLALELTSVTGNERADLTVAEAHDLREALAEFIVAYGDPPS